MYKSAFLSVCLAIAGLTAEAGASLVTVNFAAEVTSLNANVWDDSVFVGAMVYGSHTFDDSVADSNADPATGRYWQTIDGTIDVAFGVGNYAFSGVDSYAIYISNNYTGSEFDLCSLVTGNLDLTGPGEIVVAGSKLDFFGNNVVSSTDLANWPPVHAPTRELTVLVAGPSQVDVALRAEVLWITPEPTTSGLVLTLAAALLPRRRDCGVSGR